MSHTWKQKRGLRVFSVGWHTTHQASLAKLSFMESYDFIVEPWRRGFSTTQRPRPEKLRYVTHFTPDYYDFALLHIDQQSIYEPDQGNSLTKGRLFSEIKELIQKKDPNLPIVVVNHMTPFHDNYDTHEVVEKIKALTKGCYMISNSYEAQKQWGWGDVITHGLDPDDWGYDVSHFLSTGERIEPQKEPRCAVVLSPGGMEKAYRREFLTTVLKYLEDYGVPYIWVGSDSRYKFKSFDEYKDFLARSLLFFYPAWQSPRPRARTEAQLSGCCIVTTPYQDADTLYKSGSLKYKQDGEEIYDEQLFYDEETTGFLTSLNKQVDPRSIGNPIYTAMLIKNLVIDHPDVAVEIGKRGQKVARETLNHEEFEKQWVNFLKRRKLWKEL